ncbi:MAG: hypothetical protein WC511_02080 [Candidatus Pacearchaeota archaeon]
MEKITAYKSLDGRILLTEEEALFSDDLHKLSIALRNCKIPFSELDYVYPFLSDLINRDKKDKGISDVRAILKKYLNMMSLENPQKKNKLYTNMVNLPEVGEDIYVPSSYFPSLGTPDDIGGLAEVVAVDTAKSPFLISVKEHENKSYNWTYLVENQSRLKKLFKNTRAFREFKTLPSKE